MNAKTPFALKSLAIAVMAVSLAACSDSDSDTVGAVGPNPETPSETTEQRLENTAKDNQNRTPVSAVTGRVIDGYIAGATVCLDVNRNFRCDPGEPTTITNSHGQYYLDISTITSDQKLNAIMLAIGGVDQDTGLDFSGTLAAPLLGNSEGYTHITPFSTLVTQIPPDQPSQRDKLASNLDIEIFALDGDFTENVDQYRQAVRLQRTIELLTADARDGKTLQDIINALTEALLTNTPEISAATPTDPLENAINNLNDDIVPARSRARASLAASSIRALERNNLRDQLNFISQTLEEQRLEIIKNPEHELSIAEITPNGVTYANAKRLLGLIRIEDEKEINIIKQMDGLSSQTTLEELRAYLQRSEYTNTALYPAVNRAILIASADPITPLSAQQLVSRGGFIAYEFGHPWDYDYPTVEAGGIAMSESSAEFTWDARPFTPSMSIFYGESQRDDNEYLWTGKEWIAIEKERYYINDEGVMIIEAGNDSHFSPWWEMRLSAIEPIGNTETDLDIWGLSGNHRINFPANSERYILLAAATGSPVLTSFMEDSERVYIENSQTYISNWSDFQSQCITDARPCVLLKRDNKLILGEKLSDGIYQLIEQDRSGNNRIVGSLVQIKTQGNMPEYWRFDFDRDRLSDSGLAPDGSGEAYALIEQPEEFGSPNTIIGRGYISTPGVFDTMVVYSANTETAVAEYFSNGQFDQLKIELEIDAQEGCLTDERALQIINREVEDSYVTVRFDEGNHSINTTVYALSSYKTFSSDSTVSFSGPNWIHSSQPSITEEDGTYLLSGTVMVNCNPSPNH